MLSPLLLLAVILALLAVSTVLAAGGDVDVLGWNSKGSCSAASDAKQTLVFVFDDFSAAEFSRAVGAYREHMEEKCPTCTLSMVKKFLQAQPSACHGSRDGVLAPTLDGSDIKAVIAAARSGNGVHVIDMHTRLNELNTMQDAVIFEALEEALGASQKDLSVQFSGKKALEEERSSHGRTLQAIVPLTIRMAPDTFIGLLFLVLAHLLLIFFLCCCMDGIAIQTKYAKQYPLRGKELN